MIALLDGDIFTYRVGFTTENEDEGIARWRIDEMIQNCLLEVGAVSWKVFLTCPNNFRKSVYPEYKANRTQPKPRHLEMLKEYLVTEYGAVIATGMEADDYLGIHQDTKGHMDLGDHEPQFNTIICSIDKDLLQVPGLHYNFVKKEFTTIDKVTGLRNFYKQFIIGDTADNIKGIHGMGPKKASAAIDSLLTEEEMFCKVRSLYDNDDWMKMNGRLLYIKRTLEDDWGDHFERLVRGADQELHNQYG